MAEELKPPVVEEGAVPKSGGDDVAPPAPEDEAEYFVDEEISDAETVVLMCILNQGGSVLQGRRIWRRLAVPTDFNLLELHVTLQNAFDWEDTHLHDFNQPTGVQLLGGISLPTYGGHGPTDLQAFIQHMVDVEGLAPSDVRTFKAVVGIKEDPAEELLLTKAEDLSEEPGEVGEGEGKKEGDPEEGGEERKKEKVEKEEGGGRVEVKLQRSKSSRHCLVYVEHSHPHAEAEPPAEPKTAEFASAPIQVLEERAFLVGDVVTSDLPVLVYEYDFRMGYEVHVFFEGRSKATEGVNYPTCLAGQGASPAEDGDDMDDQGNLLPTYDYDDFAVLDVLANFEKTFEESWPVGPGAEDKRKVKRCFLCRYNRECGRRRECTGRCCDYCHKGPLAAEAGRLSLLSAEKMFAATAARIVEARKKWIEGIKCDWFEEDGQPCALCSE